MTLHDVQELSRRNWIFLVLAILSGLALGFGVSAIQPTLYSATSAGLVVAAPGPDGTVRNAAEKASSYLPLVRSRLVAEAIADKLALKSAESIPPSLKPKVEGAIIRITATTTNPAQAARMADAAISATSELANKLETTTITGQSTGQTVVRILPLEPAVQPSNPVSPKRARNLVLGVMLSLIAGLGVAVLRYSTDRRVRRSDDVESYTGAAVLANLPHDPLAEAGGNITHSFGPLAEALRKLRMNLKFVRVDNPPRSITVTSCGAGEGKSTISGYLARLIAESGQPTVLIDADLRLPVLAGKFNVDGSSGLTQLLSGEINLTQALVPTDQANLLLLPAGRIPPNPTELLGSARMQSLVSGLSQKYMVIIDSPPLLPVADAGLLAAAADGALLVVQFGQTSLDHLSMAARSLRQLDAPLLGTALNMVTAGLPYSAGYGYAAKESLWQASKPESASPTGTSSHL